MFYYFHFRYIITNFDSNTAALPVLKDYLSKDLDVIRLRLLRKEVEVKRPCEEIPCDFGEINDAIRNKLAKDLTTSIKKL